MSGARPFTVQCPLPAGENDTIELAHGGGGLLTKRLVDSLFRPAFADSADAMTHDGAVFDIDGTRIAFSTDSYVVRPLFFPGGDIGSLAVNGTVNDLAMCGAEPLYLSVGVLLEEGFAIAELRRVVASMQAAARTAGVRLVTGDTKVVERGKGDGVYLNTAGIGRVITPSPVAPQRVQPGDAIVLSGDIGRHGIAIMAAREGFGFESEIVSDCAPVAAAVRALVDAGIELHCLRDLTRGGLATALIEIAEAGNVGMRLDDAVIAVTDPVRGACELLGLDPLYVANEGRFVAIVPSRDADATVAALKQYARSAAVIGRIHPVTDGAGVELTTIGGTRPLDLLSGEQLPRIC
jgi:hydrogenase expression/formation protein HypE